jgi:hypothetical protein
MMRTTYEWDTEIVGPSGDVVDHLHRDTLAESIADQTDIDLPLGHTIRTVLVRDTECEHDGLVDRQWAYVTPSGLPVYFDDGACDRNKVPQRFHREVASFLDVLATS